MEDILRYYESSLDKDSDELEIDRTPFVEISELVEVLKAADVEGFILSNQSAALMKEIHEFTAAGCQLKGPCTFEKNKWPGHPEVGKMNCYGLKFKEKIF